MLITLYFSCLVSFSPPSSFYSRKPVIVLPSIPFSDSEESGRFEDSLDRHVDDVLRRPTKLRRTLMGVWSFLKTRKMNSLSLLQNANVTA